MVTPIGRSLPLVLLLLTACGGSSESLNLPTVTLTASAMTVLPGAMVTLAWTSTGAQSCEALGQWSGSLPLSGTRSMSPPAASNSFELNCTGPGGSATAHASVSVVLPDYTVTDVGLYGASALNDFGGVAGWTGSPPTRSGPRPYDQAAWTGGSVPALPLPPPDQDPIFICRFDPSAGLSRCVTHATGINSAGEVVVSASGGPVGEIVVHYGPGVAQVIPGLRFANAIGNTGTIVGQTDDSHPGVFASGATVDLGTLGGSWGVSNAINQLGRIVGSSTLIGEAEHAFLTDGAGLVDLGDLGGGMSAARAVNDAGIVAGESKVANGDTHAFVYADGKMIDIGVAFGTNSGATGINNAGMVVGYFSSPNSTYGRWNPALFSNGIIFDLLDVATRHKVYPAGEAAWIGQDAVRINNRGQILVPVCEGQTVSPFHPGLCWTVLLTPPANP